MRRIAAGRPILRRMVARWTGIPGLVAGPGSLSRGAVPAGAEGEPWSLTLPRALRLPARPPPTAVETSARRGRYASAETVRSW